MIFKAPKVYYIVTSLMLFLLSDALLILLPKLVEYNLSYFLKGTVLVFYLVCAIRLLGLKEFLIILLFLIIFSTSQAYLFYLNNITIEGIVINFRFFIWYLFFILLMFIYNKKNEDIYNSLSIRLLNKIAVIVITIVCFSILIGYFFDINLFWSYNKRWGYKGVLPKAITASYFFIIVLNYLYYYHVTIQKRYVFFLIVLFCSLLCGTKTIYFFNLLLLLFHIILKKKYKLKSFWCALTALLSFLAIFRDKVIAKTELFWLIFLDLYKKKGFLCSLTSYRSEMLIEGLSYYDSHWNWINYLIGGRLIDIKYFEMSFFDLFYFFGGIGFLLFLCLLISYVFVPFYKIAKIHGFFFFFSVLLASFASGQFFVNSTVIILFFYFLITIGVNVKSNEQNKHT